MILGQHIFDELTARAKVSPRLRINLDRWNSPEDLSQQMLSVIEPGMVSPIHRHRNSSETVVCLRGHFPEFFYDDSGTLTAATELFPGGIVLEVHSGQL